MSPPECFNSARFSDSAPSISAGSPEGISTAMTTLPRSRRFTSWITSLSQPCTRHPNFSARLLPAISICGRVPTHLLLSGNQNHDGRRACVSQMSRSYKPVSSVVSLPTHHDDPPRFESPKPSGNKVGNALARVFHQRQAGNTVALGCKAIDFAHLRSSQNFHGSSLNRCIFVSISRRASFQMADLGPSTYSHSTTAKKRQRAFARCPESNPSFSQL